MPHLLMIVTSLSRSLAQLGRFAEAARDEAEAIRIGEPTRSCLPPRRARPTSPGSRLTCARGIGRRRAR